MRAAVARAQVADVLNAAINQNDVVAWKKYYNGDWNEPGLGGRSSFIEPDRSGSEGESVSYNHYLGKYIMVYPGWTPETGNDFYYAESADGVNWSSRQRIESEPGSSTYPTIVGLGEEPRDSGAQFYLYYVYLTGSDYVLSRRLISFTRG